MRGSTPLRGTSILLMWAPKISLAFGESGLVHSTRTLKIMSNCRFDAKQPLRLTQSLATALTSSKSRIAKGRTRYCATRTIDRVLTISFSTSSPPTSAAGAAGDAEAAGGVMPLFYNDVYKVDLPEGHRFPMEKYRLVRKVSYMYSCRKYVSDLRL